MPLNVTEDPEPFLVGHRVIVLPQEPEAAVAILVDQAVDRFGNVDRYVAHPNATVAAIAARPQPGCCFLRDRTRFEQGEDLLQQRASRSRASHGPSAFVEREVQCEDVDMRLAEEAELPALRVLLDELTDRRLV